MATEYAVIITMIVKIIITHRSQSTKHGALSNASVLCFPPSLSFVTLYFFQLVRGLFNLLLTVFFVFWWPGFHRRTCQFSITWRQELFEVMEPSLVHGVLAFLFLRCFGLCLLTRRQELVEITAVIALFFCVEHFFFFRLLAQSWCLLCVKLLRAGC